MTDHDLFGAPPLMKGEDKDRYFRLLAAVRHEIKPKTVFDEMMVHELTDKYWEQQRCKNSAVALVEGAYIDALASLLRPYVAPTISLTDPVSETARDYYNGSANGVRMEEISSLLAQYGITEAQIRAKAMQLCGGGVSFLNRMATSCEISLRGLRKENDRRSVVDETTRSLGSHELEEVE